MDASHADIVLLLNLLDQAYNRQAWHGPNLRGSIRGLTAAQAAWRPRPKRHNIAEIIAHAAYWKYTVRRKLRGDKRGSFPLTGSNWFTLTEPFAEADWKQLVALLADEHRTLRATVAALDPNRLHRLAPTSKYTLATLIQGIAAHDVYHAGQVQVLKRLLKP